MTLQDEFASSEGLPSPESRGKFTSSQRVAVGKLVTPKQHLLLMSSLEWEEFLEEWAVFQKRQYHLVTRLGGPMTMELTWLAFVLTRALRVIGSTTNASTTVPR